MVSVIEMASRSGLHRQRINEAIRAGTLPAKRFRGRFWMKEAEAETFRDEARPRLAARAVRKQLKNIGKNREAEAVRKQIYRRSKRGASDADILEVIQKARVKLKTKSKKQ